MTALYIFSTVFGIGVIIADFFLMMSSEGDDFSDSHDSDDSASTEDGEYSTHAHEHQGSVIAHQKQTKESILLRTLGMMRNAVYFCAGFGPAGWLAESVFHEKFSFLWAAGVGFIVVMIASLFRRIRRDKLDSSVNDSELLLEKAVVLVSLGPNKMGKVRIAHGGMYVDRYAVAKSEIDEFYVGEEVRVCEVTDGYVVVEPTI